MLNRQQHKVKNMLLETSWILNIRVKDMNNFSVVFRLYYKVIIKPNTIYKFAVVYIRKERGDVIGKKEEVSFFVGKKNPEMITCPGCNKCYIGKTERCLGKPAN